MEKIELFDKYISGEMTEREISEFKLKISEDKEFASDFLVYKSVIRGIFHEEKEKEKDLDEAFLHLNKDDLRNIIGPKMVIPKPSQSKVFYMASWLAAAAVVVFAFTMTYNYQRSAQNNVDDVLFDCYYSPISRGNEDIIDLSNTDADEIKRQLPLMEETYKEVSDEQELSSYGINLAMLYLKVHERDNARRILLDVKTRSGNNDVKSICDKLLKKIE